MEVFYKNMAPKLNRKLWFDMAYIEGEVKNVLKFIDSQYLGKNKYIVSQDNITLADISAYCEIV